MYWANPLTYALKALVVNEFDSPRWDKPLPGFEAAQVLLHAIEALALLNVQGLQAVSVWHWRHSQFH
jgi:hypothetical protein